MRLILSILMLLALSAKAQFNFGNAFYVAGTIGAVSSGNPPVAGFTFWVHADDATGLFTNLAGTVPAVAGDSTGKFIGFWKDRSVIGTNSIVNAGVSTDQTRPSLSNNVFNGKPAVWFNKTTIVSSGTFLSSQTNNATFGYTTGITVFVACSFASAQCDNFGMVWSFGSGAVPALEMRRNNTASSIQASDNANSATLATLMTNGNGYCHTFRMWEKGNTDSPNGANGTLQMGRNGQYTNTSVGTVIPVQTNWSNFGSRNNGVNLAWGGFISEAIIYPWALNDTDYQLVTKYLTNKYNFVLF